MTPEILKLDRARIRDLFDLRRRGEGNAPLYEVDPYPAFHRLRETGPVHPGTVHELLNVEMEGGFQGLPEPDRPHFSAFSHAACSEAFRDDGLFTSSPTGVRGDEGVGVQSSILSMNGAGHRRYRGLVQPSFVPNQAKWWIERWIATTVHALIATFETDGRAELNVDFDAAIPLLTITGSFGVDVEDALDIRAAISRGEGRDPRRRLRHHAPHSDADYCREEGEARGRPDQCAVPGRAERRGGSAPLVGP